MDTINNDLPKEPEQNDASIAPRASTNNLAVPIAVVIAGALIAFAIYQKPAAPAPVPTGNQAAGQVTGDITMKPVSSADHLLGNPGASVVIVEYSDLECPFCKRFHPTMKQVMAEYGAKGQVAWVYRHLPLDSLHSKARKEAEASECVAKLGGNEKFWAYIDKIFEITPSNNGLDLALLPKIASDIRIDPTAFEKCLSSGETTQLVSDSVTDATNAGAQGTPYSVVIAKNGKKFPINGALPYANVKQAIDAALAEK